MQKILSLAAFFAFFVILSGCILFPNGFPPQSSQPAPPPSSNASQSQENFSNSNLSDLQSQEPQISIKFPPSSYDNESMPSNNSNASQEPQSNSSLAKEPALPPTLGIYYLDAGFGDATLVVMPNFTMLVDAGPAASAKNIVSFITRLGITHIDVFALTQWESGKIGGLDAIFNQFSIGEIWVPTDPPQAYSLKYAAVAVEQSGAAVRRIAAGDKFNYSGNLIIEILNPPNPIFSSSQNANSLAMQLSFGKFCAFFPGDIDVEQEAPILPKVKAFCPVYKWPYHGKAGPQPSILYDRLHPADVIISVGKNDAGFPSPTAITRISLSKARLWRTDSGNIFLNATLGGNYSIKIIK